jgi:hypothetical protein
MTKILTLKVSKKWGLGQLHGEIDEAGSAKIR